MKQAIALAGGGTKGAYQVGAWKAMRELGIPFDIVTGTSIGSVTAALMVQGDFDRAWELWTHITEEQIMLERDDATPHEKHELAALAEHPEQRSMLAAMRAFCGGLPPGRITRSRCIFLKANISKGCWSRWIERNARNQRNPVIHSSGGSDHGKTGISRNRVAWRRIRRGCGQTRRYGRRLEPFAGEGERVGTVWCGVGGEACRCRGGGLSGTFNFER